jgi:general secretion pathway protein D
MSPAFALALGDGKKHFRAGLDYEASETWDKAAEEFALAVADNPKNPEYRLHLQRAMFNASQMYMKQGTTAANEKDYQGAYNAFRRSYAFDPTNELAKSEMERMVRAQQGLKDGSLEEKKGDDGKVKLVPTGYSPTKATADAPLPQQFQKLRDVPFPSGVNLQFLVKVLAKDLDLNVLFDRDSNLDQRMVKIELHDVTAAKALDYIFLQENLFFQKVGPRTILVASNTRRVNFQQLVLRTFYLSNANPKDVKTVIQTAIPAQPGRSQTIVLEDAATNSITVRDTEENVRLIGKLISSLDKDRAEVVMDVAIYEVNKNDLLQWGNQIGSASSLVNLGGTSSAVVGLGGNDNYGNAAANAARGITNAAKAVMPYAFGAGIILPAANLSAFQSKTNTKLIASTQIHAFNNEDSSARIGQRVPVKTAQVQTGNAVGGGAVVSDVINYEQVGLTLKFKPLVFPNQDVQVAMEIESKDVNGVSGQDLLPTFTERTIKGTARVQNNKTLLLASVAQGVESNGRSGLPILGLIPILGNLFTAPTKDNRQVDIVIAITPKVIRAPAILPEDEIERPTGTLQTPTNSSLEAMVEQEARDEMLASARRVPNQAQVQLPDQPADAPQYVRGATTTSGAVAQNDNAPTGATSTNGAQPAPSTLQPIDSGVKTLQIKQTADTSAAGQPVVQPVDNATADPGPKPQVSISLPSELPTLKPGERAKIAVTASNSAAFRSAVLGLRYDSSKFAVRSVEYGDIFGGGVANTAATPFLNEKGKTNVSFSLPQGTVAAGNGILAYIEVEALSEGRPQITFDKDVMNFLTAEGRNFVVSF